VRRRLARGAGRVGRPASRRLRVSMSGRTCAHTSSVKATVAWPRRSLTVFGSTPESSMSVAGAARYAVGASPRGASWSTVPQPRTVHIQRVGRPDDAPTFCWTTSTSYIDAVTADTTRWTSQERIVSDEYVNDDLLADLRVWIGRGSRALLAFHDHEAGAFVPRADLRPNPAAGQAPLGARVGGSRTVPEVRNGTAATGVRHGSTGPHRCTEATSFLDRGDHDKELRPASLSVAAGN
jgi:hypothetical protein